MRTLNIYPYEFPEPWASDWGEDEYGLWMGFTYKGVKQFFRWIEPGTFMMGSPTDELERSDDEIQHSVTITQGYWLADSTVTQALWQAAMGTNSSYFKGENLPVEQVSWKDAQRFIDTLNSLKPELKLCLPTEAQWEFACRAGTTTPFSFGDQINASQVNFDGNHPYNNGRESEYRNQTVAVKSLPPNLWGLYEIHGNVWEWCQDWYGEYPTGTVIDPTGKDTGDSPRFAWRLVDQRRQGLPFCLPSSAARPALRAPYFGFRLARGH